MTAQTAALAASQYSEAVAHFEAHASFMCNPATESKEAAKRNNAQQLAMAERAAQLADWDASWKVDPDSDSANYPDHGTYDEDEEPYPLWCCILRDNNGRFLQALGAVDFGPNGGPTSGDHYARVIEAELALAALTDY